MIKHLLNSHKTLATTLFVVGSSWSVFFGLWFVVYRAGINTLAIQSEDTIPALVLPVTVINEQTLYADSYYQMIISAYPHPDDKNYQKGLTPFYFRKVGEHYISAFPIISGLMGIPVYFVPLLTGIDVTWENLTILSHASAALVVAVSGGLFYLLCRKFISDKKSLLLAGVYLFCTINFASVAQSLWQHGPAQFFIILSLLFMFQGRRRTSFIFLSGVALGFGVLARPTVGIMIPFFILLWTYLWGKEHVDMVRQTRLSDLSPVFKPIAVFLVGFLPAVAFFAWYNKAYFLTIANQGYANQINTNWLTPFPWGFLGLWFSPSKGLLVYSPFFVFSLIGFYKTFRKGAWREDLVNTLFFSIVVTYTIVLGSWKHWYGGYSFGYRMVSEIIPLLVLLLIPYLKSPCFTRTKVVFCVTLLVSLCFELMGVAFFDGIWHGTYDRGFWNQEWLWSIRNSELIFNLERLLVKLRL